LYLAFLGRFSGRAGTRPSLTFEECATASAPANWYALSIFAFVYRYAYMTLDRCPLSVFYSRGTPPSNPLSQPALSLSIANMAQARLSRPDSGLVFQVKDMKTIQNVLSLLGVGTRPSPTSGECATASAPANWYVSILFLRNRFRANVAHASQGQILLSIVANWHAVSISKREYGTRVFSSLIGVGTQRSPTSGDCAKASAPAN
jgi:hypothetical protein